MLHQLRFLDLIFPDINECNDQRKNTFFDGHGSSYIKKALDIYGIDDNRIKISEECNIQKYQKVFKAGEHGVYICDSDDNSCYGSFFFLKKKTFSNISAKNAQLLVALIKI